MNLFSDFHCLYCFRYFLFEILPLLHYTFSWHKHAFNAEAHTHTYAEPCVYYLVLVILFKQNLVVFVGFEFTMSGQVVTLSIVD